MGYKENVGDGSDVTPTLSIITPDDGPCSFFPSLLYKTEIKLLDLTSSNPAQLTLSNDNWLISCLLQFLPFFGLRSCFFAGRKSQCSCTYGSRCSRNTWKEQSKHFCQPFRKVAAQKTATSHLGIDFHRSLLLWILEAFSLFHSRLQRSVNSQSQRNTGSCLN